MQLYVMGQALGVSDKDRVFRQERVRRNVCNDYLDADCNDETHDEAGHDRSDHKFVGNGLRRRKFGLLSHSQ